MPEEQEHEPHRPEGDERGGLPAGEEAGEQPKSVRGEPLETSEGVRIPAQQAVGAQATEGGGEFPYPATPPQEPAPGAAASAGEDDEAGEPGTGERERESAEEDEGGGGPTS